jgi:hypothetical protein
VPVVALANRSAGEAVLRAISQIPVIAAITSNTATVRTIRVSVMCEPAGVYLVS